MSDSTGLTEHMKSSNPRQESSLFGWVDMRKALSV